MFGDRFGGLWLPADKKPLQSMDLNGYSPSTLLSDLFSCLDCQRLFYTWSLQFESREVEMNQSFSICSKLLLAI
ncbi:hypothetical protein I7I50_03936 [Histoplasma capsulatum G186AR]|uniref:Uncharacterized protein n=1 Tax=Ajellomyces capsulatus TaxID=5037 RepID=A0A8H8CWU3_AJECA|nr:hypothetical protein I7I52_04844 [Histoplasma capsulatum]QSS74957.1 hypothetical protein I7I50_03936 [Histoplasma capsulatum G186AR]